jgi:putative transposase
MAKPYSIDLRERVVAAVEEGGQSRRQAADHFGVGISTAIEWVRRYRETGSVEPGQMGGHRPKKISGAYRDWLLERCREKEFTLRGLVDELVERGLKVDYRSVWEFVHAEKLSFKKNRARQRAGSSRRGAPAGPVDQISGSD